MQNIAVKNSKVIITVSRYSLKENTIFCSAVIRINAVTSCENRVPRKIPKAIEITPITKVSMKNIKATFFCGTPSNI
ncbi:hypothetical protein SDC9_161311 [bioreactor metagenome]|uniref:Uncharacterized protein n=1 Tax=bioreactor metagenome TaxID=1076179 RepID=A0A645FHS7_9ZZZZ